MKLSDIAKHLDCELRGDGNVDIRGLAPIDSAEPSDLTFVANPRYRAHLRTTKAAAAIVATAEEDVTLPTLRTADPYAAFARAIDLFHVPPPQTTGIDATAVIHPTAKLGNNVAIGPYSVIGEGVVVGDDAVIDAHVVIYPEVRIGSKFRAFANVVVRERVIIGNRVVLQSGCVVGGDGFGYILGADASVRKITQGGTVILEDDVEVGANTTIDRAAIGATLLKRAVKLDNLVMIAHGCEIGEGSALAAQTGLSGSTRVGRFVRMGGQVGSAGHLLIGDGAQIAAQSGLPSDVAAGSTMGGSPAVEIHQWRRQSAALARLPELLRRVRRIEAALKLGDSE